MIFSKDFELFKNIPLKFINFWRITNFTQFSTWIYYFQILYISDIDYISGDIGGTLGSTNVGRPQKPSGPGFDTSSIFDHHFGGFFNTDNFFGIPSFGGFNFDRYKPWWKGWVKIFKFQLYMRIIKCKTLLHLFEDFQNSKIFKVKIY